MENRITERVKIDFDPMRSLMYLNVNNEYYHKLDCWLHRVHVPESISQFGPYVTRYAFYKSLPIPEGSERFGVCNYQLTEHHWLVNPFSPQLKIKTVQETMPLEVLKWEGLIPDEFDPEASFSADEARGKELADASEVPPLAWNFVPMWWEEEFKGEKRCADDGDNFRWQFVVKYPDGVSKEEGDKWMLGEVLPKFAQMEESVRILTSAVMQDVNASPFARVVEIWFDLPRDWKTTALKKSSTIQAPSWASEGNCFPYLRPAFEIQSMFLSDMPTFDHLGQYTGHITMR
ncbi:MAG: acetyl-CoA hydrolase [Lachnospiraceae bacterium]|nr:acetyl-CoA hydrolase [Lachnospiraceae bacterium]